LIISDNSTNDETKAIFEKKYYNKARYIHRIPTSSDHFNLILKEVDSEYFMMFHDDDVLLADMLQEFYENISNYFIQSVQKISTLVSKIRKSIY
jgi:hypothetical protein